MLLLENMLHTAEIWWKYNVLLPDLMEINSVVGPNSGKNIVDVQGAAIMAFVNILNNKYMWKLLKRHLKQQQLFFS